jgi:hypothetical protein
MDFSGLERRHRALLFGRLEPTVHERDAQSRQRRRELGVRDLGRLRFELFGFLDQRAHPVRLASFAARGANAFDDVGAPRRSAKAPAARISYIVVAALRSVFSYSSITG